jgi:hypothetical protein
MFADTLQYSDAAGHSDDVFASSQASQRQPVFRWREQRRVTQLLEIFDRDSQLRLPFHTASQLRASLSGYTETAELHVGRLRSIYF